MIEVRRGCELMLAHDAGFESHDGIGFVAGAYRRVHGDIGQV
ncbi:hypothetical protein [Nonomuraea sp. NPDC003709]